MDDLISRQAAIDVLEKSRFPGVPYIDTGIQIALREIKAIPAADVVPVQKWISVKDKLPETRESILGKKSSKVIVAFRFDDETQGTDTAHMLNGEWVFEDHITVVARTITHWMPLPQPPKGE